ncbi:cytochrome P450 9e2-like [Leptopilina boulardi]|uniref:cytochrome P450 9e2-like n=1 Tax=Leptopilina boulardi TaxID=63433 RepID=UPI0021F584D0|nr:cytochrome P450 9e2-like [Leptopilina boulardi]
MYYIDIVTSQLQKYTQWNFQCLPVSHQLLILTNSNMEMLNLVIFTVCLGAIGVLVYFYWQMNFWKRKGIPQIQCLPIIGSHFKLITGRIAISDFVKYLYSCHQDAKYFGMFDFNTPLLVVRDPDLIKEIGVKSFEHFLDHKSFLDETMDPIFGKNVFSLKGDRWKEMRNTLSPSFTAAKMKFIFELIDKCASDFVQYFLDHSDETKSINTKDAFTRYTNDVIATAAFGITVNSMQDKENEFYVHGADASSFRGFWRFAKFIMFRMFPSFLRLIGEPFVSRSSARFFKAVIRETLNEREKNKIIRPDMIHLLMEAKEKEDGINLSVDDIVAQSFIFFLAGFETSSTLMSFLTHELVMNPEIQEKLRNEVDMIIERDNSKITYETLSKMKYLDMVVSECLRKYPPSPVVDRVCVKTYTLPKPTPDSNEYIVEPNTSIWFPVNGIHHDPKYYPDPEKFDPERFSDENKDNIHPYAYLPFGLGPRKCIGNRFALMETKLLIVYIMKHFILERTEKTQHPLKFEISVTIGVQGGTWAKFVKRTSKVS